MHTLYYHRRMWSVDTCYYTRSTQCELQVWCQIVKGSKAINNAQFGAWCLGGCVPYNKYMDEMIGSNVSLEF